MLYRQFLLLIIVLPIFIPLFCMQPHKKTFTPREAYEIQLKNFLNDIEKNEISNVETALLNYPTLASTKFICASNFRVFTPINVAIIKNNIPIINILARYNALINVHMCKWAIKNQISSAETFLELLRLSNDNALCYGNYLLNYAITNNNPLVTELMLLLGAQLPSHSVFYRHYQLKQVIASTLSPQSKIYKTMKLLHSYSLYPTGQKPTRPAICRQYEHHSFNLSAKNAEEFYQTEQCIRTASEQRLYDPIILIQTPIPFAKVHAQLIQTPLGMLFKPVLTYTESYIKDASL